MDCNYLQSFVGLSRHGCCIEEIKFNAKAPVVHERFSQLRFNGSKSGICRRRGLCLTPIAYTDPFVAVGPSTLNEVRVALLRRDSDPKQHLPLASGPHLDIITVAVCKNR